MAHIIPEDQERRALDLLTRKLRSDSIENGPPNLTAIVSATGLSCRTLKSMFRCLKAVDEGRVDVSPYTLQTAPWYVLNRRFKEQVLGKRYKHADKVAYGIDPQERLEKHWRRKLPYRRTPSLTL